MISNGVKIINTSKFRFTENNIPGREICIFSLILFWGKALVVLYPHFEIFTVDIIIWYEGGKHQGSNDGMQGQKRVQSNVPKRDSE